MRKFIFVNILKNEYENYLLTYSMVPFFEGMTKMNLRFWILQTLLLMLHIPFFHLPLLVSIQTPISQLRPYINRYAFITDHLYDI